IYGEPVQVSVLKQDKVNGVLLRSSVLYGTISGAKYVAADSKIATSLFDDRVLEQFNEGKEGIGSILLKSGLRCKRRIETIGFNFDQGCPFRRYTISCNGRTCINITERILPEKHDMRVKPVDRVGFEPTTSAMPMPYPTGLDDRPNC